MMSAQVKVPIRRATSADVDTFRQIAQAAFEPFIQKIGRAPAPMMADFADRIDNTLALLAGAPPAGYALVVPGGASWHIENLAIMPSAEGQGIARALLHEIEARAIAHTATTLDLYTNATMDRAQTFYLKAGFVEEARRTVDGFDRIFYRKPLWRR